MYCRVTDLINEAAAARPAAPALSHGGELQSYGELAETVQRAARGLVGLGLARGDRVAVFLEKRLETIAAFFAAAAAGCAFVPVNPQLKPRQVAHILADCGARALVTSQARLAALGGALEGCDELKRVILVDGVEQVAALDGLSPVAWQELLSGAPTGARLHPTILDDMAAILYTSGSTGLPKGVVLSHKNLVIGAQSVASYLENGPEDRILSLLPLSFDAGLSQATTAFCTGAKLVLMNYLLPGDVPRLCAEEGITGITGVPPLWIRLAELDWPESAAANVRYFANTGGHLPRAVLGKLRARLPKAKPYLMYGLTEAFRSTYLDPALVDERPDSMGKAIPNAEILVLRPDGSPCDPGEPGELVHRGPLVSLGYWNDPERTAERFRPLPPRASGLTRPEIAVWSGDRVRRDEDGFLYFIGRDDEMIKTSGYRVSPTEIEEAAYATGLVGEAVALALPHEVLGQAIVLLATAAGDERLDAQALLVKLKAELPSFMVPSEILVRDHLPRNPNGKFDRKAMAQDLMPPPLERSG